MPVHIEGGVDAEKDDMPDMLIPVNWEEMKKFFRKETSKLTEKNCKSKNLFVFFFTAVQKINKARHKQTDISIYQ